MLQRALDGGARAGGNGGGGYGQRRHNLRRQRQGFADGWDVTSANATSLFKQRGALLGLNTKVAANQEARLTEDAQEDAWRDLEKHGWQVVWGKA